MPRTNERAKEGFVPLPRRHAPHTAAVSLFFCVGLSAAALGADAPVRIQLDAIGSSGESRGRGLN